MPLQLRFPEFDLPASPLTSSDAYLSTHVLRHFPDIPSDAKCIHAKRLGTAAELFVDSLLIRLGFDPIASHEFQPFDRIIPIGAHYAKLQIKVRLSAERGRFVFGVMHGNPRHASRVRAYRDDDFDLLAMVCLHQNIAKFSCSKERQQVIDLSEVTGLRARPFETLAAAITGAGLMTEIPDGDVRDWPAAA